MWEAREPTQIPLPAPLAPCSQKPYDTLMFYEQVTQGIRVSVRSSFSLSHSNPEVGKFVFVYRVEMENQGSESARLLFRHWHIHDAKGEDTEVDGEGVVGKQPTLGPGHAHRYESSCVLRSPVGFMEGYYTFVRPDGREFRVSIPRFDLAAPLAGGLSQDPAVLH